MGESLTSPVITIFFEDMKWGGCVLMQKIVNVIDKITDIFGKIISWIIVLLTIIVVVEVVRRRILRDPSYWAFELSTFLFGIHFMLAASYGMLHESHVRITILADKL